MHEFYSLSYSQKIPQNTHFYKNKIELKSMKENCSFHRVQREAYMSMLSSIAHLNFNEDFSTWFRIFTTQITKETQLGIRTVHKILKELTKKRVTICFKRKKVVSPIVA